MKRNRHGKASILTAWLLLWTSAGLAGTMDESPLRLAVTPQQQQILAGEPAFVKVSLSNESSKDVSVEWPRSLSPRIADWCLEVASPGEEAFRSTPLQWRTISQASGEAVKLPPDEKLEGVLPLWVRAGCNENEKHAGFIFSRPGRYRYRLQLHVHFEGPDGRGKWHTASGEVVVSRRGQGFERFSRQIQRLVSSWGRVSPEDRQTLQSIIGGLEGSPYATHAKWLWLAALSQGQFTALDAPECGARVLQSMWRYSGETLREFGGTGFPPEEVALASRCIAWAYQRHVLEIWAEEGMRGLQKEGLEHLIGVICQQADVDGGPDDLRKDIALSKARTAGKEARKVLQELRDRFGAGAARRIGSFVR